MPPVSVGMGILFACSMLIALTFAVAEPDIYEGKHTRTDGQTDSEDSNKKDFVKSLIERSTLNAEKRPFFVGSRYGRSDTHEGFRPVNVMPRNDKFFIGSRYGKRTAGFTDDLSPRLDSNRATCFYTGVLNLYRCYERIGSDLSDSSGNQ